MDNGKIPEHRYDKTDISERTERKMKEIRILTMELENFKCHSRLELDFGGENVRILGDNGTGKTSIYDALTWVLFGTDSAGNGERIFPVKPLGPDGNTRDKKAVTAAEVVFRVGDEVLKLRKTCQEKWEQGAFVGNSYGYYVDGVPMRRSAYDGKIRELVPEEVFRLLTGVAYFAGEMKWQERRAILFAMAGRLDDRALMEGDDRFRELAARMEDGDFDGLRLKLHQQKKDLMGTKNDLPPRISECRRTLEQLMPAGQKGICPTCGRVLPATITMADLTFQTQSRIGDLQEQAERTEKALERVDCLLNLAECFVHYKASLAEEQVNRLFRLARFRLFRVCGNGTLEERCDVTCGGVPYPGLNQGMRVNVGIDLINSLGRYYGVRVPLFLDNAEGVVHPESCESQLIRLMVKEGEGAIRIERG